MPLYRKKPLVVKAYQVPPPMSDETAEAHGKLAGWMMSNFKPNDWEVMNSNGELYISHPIGFKAYCGEWILKFNTGIAQAMSDADFKADFEPIEGE